MSADLTALRWWRWCFTLRHVPRKEDFSHPLYVFRAVLRYALRSMKTPQLPEGPAFTFHSMAEPFGTRLEPERLYHIALILPEEHGLAAIEAIARDWAQRQPPQHFEVVDLGEPEPRSLAQLLAETPQPDGEVLQLRLHTPLEFEAVEKVTSWVLNPAQLQRLVKNAIRTLCPSYSPGRLEPLPLQLGCHLWKLQRYSHQARSQPGNQLLTGWVGPLLVRGHWRELWPQLLLAQEFHLGPGRPLGQGHCTLSAPQPVLDPRLADERLVQQTWAQLQEDEAPFASPLADPGQEAQALRVVSQALGSGQWAAGTALLVEIPKGSGQPGHSRTIATLPAADRLAHQCLHAVLHPVLDLFLCEAAVGYRQGRSIDTARQMIQQAFQQGYDWVAETDISSFFDQIPWQPLEQMLQDHALSPADTATLHALRTILRTPATLRGDHIRRTKGLLQGSPLSPLLANFYLHGFDTALLATGCRLVRYGDDFILLGRSEEEVTAALDTARQLLTRLGLELQASKTAILHSSRGFRFLGMELGGPPDAQAAGAAEEGVLRKPLYLTARHLWAGLEVDALTVKERSSLRLRVPLARVSEVILAGLGGVSVPLLERCSRERIPVTLGSPMGYILGTLHPEPRSALDCLISHHSRFASMSPPQHLDAARRLVHGKLQGYLRWLQDVPKAEAQPLARQLETLQNQLPAAPSVDSLRGYEGTAARYTYRWINDRVQDDFFRSQLRLPRERRDPWNSLLDLTSWLLYTRLHTLLKARSLHPYLGWLHSPQNHYPSLVCDLQEPFRARLERMLVRTLNRKMLQPDDFQQRPDLTWRLSPRAMPKFIDAVETELDTRQAGDTLTLRRILDAQVQALRAWAQGHRPDLYLYGSAPEAPAPPPPVMTL